jgi:hypothetical protein
MACARPDSISTVTKKIYRKQQRTAVAVEAPSSACPRYIPPSLSSPATSVCVAMSRVRLPLWRGGPTPVMAWRDGPNAGRGKAAQAPGVAWMAGAPARPSLARPLAERRPRRVAWAGLGCHLAMMASDLSSFAPLVVEWLYSATALWA